MTDFRMPDTWYDSPDFDEVPEREECEDDCAFRDGDHPGQCMSVEDLRADEAEARREAERDNSLWHHEWFGED